MIVTKVWALERTEQPRRSPAPMPGVSGHNTSLTRSPFDARMRPPSSRQHREHAVAELRAVAPAGHSFGRCG